MPRFLPAALIILLASPPTPPATAFWLSGYGPVEVVSRAHPGLLSESAGGESLQGSVSADGRYVVFTSAAANLISGGVDTNRAFDVFLHDRVTRTTALVSHADGAPATAADGQSHTGAISADGRFIVFESDAPNLVPGPAGRLFLHDRLTGTTEPIDSPEAVGFDASLSADGRFIAYTAFLAVDTGFRQNVLLHDRVSGTTTLVSHAAGAPDTQASSASLEPHVSGDGRFVLFGSLAADLVAGQVDPVFGSDLFLHDRLTGTNTLVSHAAGQPATAADAPSFLAEVSADGRFIAFASLATNLVAGQIDPFSTRDAFLHDRSTGTTILLSHAAGAPATAGAGGEIGAVAISADGGTAAFDSTQGNLFPGPVDLDGKSDVFLFDRATGTTTRAPGSSAAEGWTSPRLSADGRFAVFGSFAFPPEGVFLYDREDGDLTLVDHARSAPDQPGNGQSFFPLISADGDTVVLGSEANDLVARDLNTVSDMFAWDRRTGRVELVSRRARDLPSHTGGGSSSTARPRSSISADGRFVAFVSNAPNLAPGQVPGIPGDATVSTQVFLRDRLVGTTRLISHAHGAPGRPAGGYAESPSISLDGRFVAFASTGTDLVAGQDDAEESHDVFLYDRLSGTTILVSHGTTGPAVARGGYFPLLSGDGRSVVFLSGAADLVPGQSDGNEDSDVFRYDRLTGSIALVSHRPGAPTGTGNFGLGPLGIDALAVTPTGRFIAFASFASDLVPGDGNGTSDLFLYDHETGSVALVSHAAGSPGASANGESGVPAISATGRFIAFESSASDLIPGGVPGEVAVFLHDRLSEQTVLVSHAAGDPAAPAGGPSRAPVIDATGRWVAFTSEAGNVIPGQVETNFDSDVFLWDRATGTATLVSRSAEAPATTGNLRSHSPALSLDGRRVAFVSEAADLVPGLVDEGFAANVFVHDRVAGTTELLDHVDGAPAVPGNSESGLPAIDLLGRCVAWSSLSNDLAPADFNERSDVFVSCRGGD